MSSAQTDLSVPSASALGFNKSGGEERRGEGFTPFAAEEQSFLYVCIVSCWVLNWLLSLSLSLSLYVSSVKFMYIITYENENERERERERI